MVFTALEQQLVETIHWSLANMLYTNATFLAERLVAESSSSSEDKEAKLNMLAKCYLAEGSPNKAVILLKHASSEENCYLYANACFQIGAWEEVERALTRPRPIPQGAAGVYLLGQACEKQARLEEACNYYQKALEMNPCLWSAMEKLCKLGSPVDSFQKTEALKENPPRNAIRQRLANAYRSKKKPQKAKQVTELQQMLSEMGKALQLLSAFEIDEALRQLHGLPENQVNTGWGLCQIAKCYFEKFDFQMAIDYFQRAFKEEPQRIDDTDIYSTALWYEKRGTDLCYLLHNQLKNAYHAPQTWLISGNFYSLQKDRETAIKCFTRAIQLNPFYSYAYSLCGHEYLGNEDYEKAKYHYEAAKNMDNRQYTAHWGLGSLFYKQEKYSQSLQCYRNASQINPKSAILLTYLGVNYKAMNKFQEAIDCYQSAIRLDKKNPLPRFQLGVLLAQMDRNQEALEQLEALREESPKESHLYVQIGKIYAKLEQPHEALKYYNIALDLNPKGQSDIKNLIEQLHGTPNFPIIP